MNTSRDFRTFCRILSHFFQEPRISKMFEGDQRVVAVFVGRRRIARATNKITRPLFSRSGRKTKISLAETAIRSSKAEGTTNKTRMTNYVSVTLVYRSHRNWIKSGNRQAIHQDGNPSPNAILIHLIIEQSLFLNLRPIFWRRDWGDRSLYNRSYLTSVLYRDQRRKSTDKSPKKHVDRFNY